ncbi:MAG: hypothetical protein IKC04_00920, partial [Oscillospiraceae bacterium]|nr:hypothetical protein [Oscillospiraceae bacterium]
MIPDAAAPEAPAVETIETAPTEAVAALQDVAADDVAMVIDYNTGTETGYATVKAAYQAAGQIEGTCEVLLLKDVTYVLTSGSSATSGFLNGTASTKANYKSWNMENYMDSEVAVNGFWLDLGGHTITVRCPNTSSNNAGYYNPAFFLGDSIPLNVKNGTIIYKYARTTQSSGVNLVSLGYAGTTNSNYAIGTADDLYTPSVTLKDVNFFRVHNGGDLSGKEYSNAGPVIGVAMLASNINLIRSDIFSTGGYAINYNRNTYRATAPEGTTATTHNLTIEDSRIATGSEERAAINAASIATSTGLALEKVDLNVTLKGAAQFIGKSAVSVAEGGPTLNFAQAEQLTASSTVFTVPDVASLVTISETSNTAPANLPPAIYDSLAYFDAETHVHYPVEHAAVEATDTTMGVAAHWVCESCGTYYEADGVTETTFAALAVCTHTAKAHVNEV